MSNMNPDNKIATVGDCRELSGIYFLEKFPETKCVTYQEASDIFLVTPGYKENQLVKLSDLRNKEEHTFSGTLHFENNSPYDLDYIRIGCGGSQIGSITNVPAFTTVDITLASNNAGNGEYVQSCTLNFAYSMYDPQTCFLHVNGYVYQLTGEDLDDEWKFIITLDMAQDMNTAVLTAA